MVFVAFAVGQFSLYVLMFFLCCFELPRMFRGKRKCLKMVALPCCELLELGVVACVCVMGALSRGDKKGVDLNWRVSGSAEASGRATGMGFVGLSCVPVLPGR